MKIVMHKKLALGLAVSLCLQGAIAEENSWKGEGELGFTQTSGNTETQSLVAKLALGYQLFSWDHSLKLEALRAEDHNTLMAESYGANLQSDYNLSESSYLFGKIRYNKDRFSGYDYQSSLIFGYGYQVIDTERTGLKLEAGIGAGQNNMELDVYSQTDAQMIGFLGLNFRHKIGAHSELTQDLKVEGGTENVYTESLTGFKVNVFDNLAMKLSLSIKNNSDTPPDVEKTDTVTAVTMVYSF
jgi:putative salt-induced outer membrane protein